MNLRGVKRDIVNISRTAGKLHIRKTINMSIAEADVGGGPVVMPAVDSGIAAIMVVETSAVIEKNDLGSRL